MKKNINQVVMKTSAACVGGNTPDGAGGVSGEIIFSIVAVLLIVGGVFIFLRFKNNRATPCFPDVISANVPSPTHPEATINDLGMLK